MKTNWCRFLLLAGAAFAWQGVALLEAQANRTGMEVPAPAGSGGANARGTTLAAIAGTPLPGNESNAVVDKLLDRIVERERQTLEALRPRTPLIETYIQETPGGNSPTKDHYFLGRFRLGENISYEPLISGEESAPVEKTGLRFLHHGPAPVSALTFLPRGFAQMAAIDLQGFNRQTYRFEYVRREFLGEVRCFVFDVAPVNRYQPGKFVGRIWVEDRDDAIVRFNGTYIPTPTPKGAIPELYFHFDSWRENVGTGLWIPAQIYIEEEGAQAGGGTRFKAQSRIWDYAAMPMAKINELTSILVEGESNVKDDDVAKDVSPLESQRSWEQQAEANMIARLEKGGFLAPPSKVDDVLNTVVNNLVVSAKLNVSVHCRVLLTTPLETFVVGHTIVISRGLIDVLPDETSLALVLADQLAHVALGHRTQTQYAFTDQTMVSDAQLLQMMRFQRTPEEMEAAGKKTIEMIQASPYKDTSNAGLFMKAMAMRVDALTHLLHANLGDQMADAQSLARLRQFTDSAPALEDNKLEQIAALPLGSRIRLNPWNNPLELIKTRPLSLLSPREKMPFEVTPFALYLTRMEVPATASASER
jgi:hypothetical protein